MLTLILGGVRSGKSRLAERLATRGGGPVCYVATATAGDGEMRRRIAAHRHRRPPDWTVIEEPIHLAAALRPQADAGRPVIVDCLTLWLTNLLVAGDETQWQRERQGLLNALSGLAGEVYLVANEASLGITPLGALSRRFLDEAGCLHQDLAQRCERVLLTVAGLPMVLKGEPL